MASLPSNVHVSTHPCVQAKLSQLRSASASTREVKSLIHEISTIVGVEALAKGLTTTSAGTVSFLFPHAPSQQHPDQLSASLRATAQLPLTTSGHPLTDAAKPTDGLPHASIQDQNPLGYSFPVTTISPSRISLVPILRSGLGMTDALLSVLPAAVPVHHLGLYREKTTLQPVEYYNNLPYHKPTASNPSVSTGPSDLAIIVDPVIATGATACAAIDTLRDWGVKKVIVCAVIASEDGLRKAAETWPEGVEVFAGGCDKGMDDKGMIKPGLGDVGDRLFLTIGK